MVQPIQYQVPGVTDPFANVVQGLRLGATLSELDAARATQALKQQELQAKLAQQQRMQAALTQFNAKPREQRTDADYESLGMLLPAEQSNALRQWWEAKGKTEKERLKLDIGQTLAALRRDPAAAEQKLNLLAEGYRNKGDTQSADMYSAFAKSAKTAPLETFDSVLGTVSGTFGKDWTTSILQAGTGREAEAAALRKATAEADKAVEDARISKANAVTAADEAAAALRLKRAQAAEAEVKARVARAEEQLTGGFKATDQIRNAEFYRNASPKQQEALENVIKLGRSTTEIIMPGETTGQRELAQAAPTWASQMRDAANITGDVNRYRKLLPKAITGAFADQRAAVARAFGFGAENLAATREVVRGLGRFVLNGRGKLEGQGAISNFEQEVIAKAESGDISLSPAELSILFDAVERDARLLYQQNRSLFDNTKEAYPTVKIFDVLSKSVPKLPEPVRAAPPPPAPAPVRPAAAAPATVTPAPPPGFGPRAVTGTVTPAESFPVAPQPGVRTQSLQEIFSGTSVAR